MVFRMQSCYSNRTTWPPFSWDSPIRKTHSRYTKHDWMCNLIVVNGCGVHGEVCVCERRWPIRYDSSLSAIPINQKFLVVFQMKNPMCDRGVFMLSESI